MKAYQATPLDTKCLFLAGKKKQIQTLLFVLWEFFLVVYNLSFYQLGEHRLSRNSSAAAIKMDETNQMIALAKKKLNYLILDSTANKRIYS